MSELLPLLRCSRHRRPAPALCPPCAQPAPVPSAGARSPPRAQPAPAPSAGARSPPRAQPAHSAPSARRSVSTTRAASNSAQRRRPVSTTRAASSRRPAPQPAHSTSASAGNMSRKRVQAAHLPGFWPTNWGRRRQGASLSIISLSHHISTISHIIYI